MRTQDTALLAGLSEQMQMARENALLGNYDAALVFFDGVLAQIQRYLKTVEDPFVRSQWQQAKEELTGEFRIVKEIGQELNRFREPAGRGGAAAPLGAGLGDDKAHRDVPGFAHAARPNCMHAPPACMHDANPPWDSSPPLGGFDPAPENDPDVWPPPTPQQPDGRRWGGGGGARGGYQQPPQARATPPSAKRRVAEASKRVL